MALVCKPRLIRYRRFEEYPRVNVLPLVLPSSTSADVRPLQIRTMVKTEASGKQRGEEKRDKDTRFVRVNDRLFKVPKGFFLQMPIQMQWDIKFSTGGGLTPENPILLQRHPEDQFKQILSAYNAFPSLDANSFTLDHLLTVGELSTHYGLRDLSKWFFPAFRELILGPHTPLRVTTNNFYVRMMKLALQMKSIELVGVIQAAWANRMHSGELVPIWALLFADLCGLRDLLGHACYAYLMSVASQIERGLCFNERKLLNPRQTFYIRAGYHSLLTNWRLIGRHPPEFDGDPECVLHSQCVRVWKQRWSYFLSRLKGRFPEVDVLNKLGLMLQLLKDDSILSVCLSPSCRAAALKELTTRRDRVSHQLHHHFDI